MSDLYKTILALCQNRNINITQMCKESGASRASLTDLKMGRKQSLSAETLTKIANYFGVSVDYLLNGEKENPPASREQKDDITFDDFTYAMYNESRELNEEEKQMLLELARLTKKRRLEKEKGL